MSSASSPDPAPPPGHESDFGPYGAWVHDPGCGEVIGWGFKPLRDLGYDTFAKLRAHGSWDYSVKTGLWVLVVRWLTVAEAVEKYGPITEEVRGPQGGWKYMVLGGQKKCIHSMWKTQRKFKR